MISARPPEIRSTVAKSSKTRTGSAVLRMVTALARRMRSVTAAIAANTTGGAADRHIQPMMFADRENIETRRIGKLRCRKDLRQALLGAWPRFRHKVAERIEPQFECRLQSDRYYFAGGILAGGQS